MSATLVARDVGVGFADRMLVEGLDLVVAPGDLVGLIGPNGAGKSSLVRVLAGVDEPVAGSVTLSPADAVVGWLPQESRPRPGETVGAVLGRRTGVAAADAALTAATDALAAGRPGADDAYAAALERWLALGAADLAERSAAVLSDLGLDVDPDLPAAALSGGQAARVALAGLLLSRFDLLLLDEPTNDLDLDGLARLEEFVQAQRAGIVLVSHDREFLTRCVRTVVELDAAQHRVGVFGGGYEAYLEERAVGRRHAREAYEEYADRRAALEERARTQRGWLDKGQRAAVRARGRDNDKVGRNFRLDASEKQAAKARQTERMIERLPEVAEPRKEWELRYSIAAAPGSSSVVASARSAALRRGDFTLGPVSLQVDAGDRIGITGPNGSGKSTLLRLLLGRVEPDEGTAGLGRTVAVGEIDQARRVLELPQPLLEAVRGQLPDLPPAEVRTLLAKFGLRGDQVLRPTEGLSPGERTRAAMALLQARGVNLLVLDEPTNHLDLPAITQLEEAVNAYSGTLLLVTHDRRMLAAVRLTRQWAVRDGSVTEV